MKRYLLFAGEQYEEGGGFNDFQESSDFLGKMIGIATALNANLRWQGAPLGGTVYDWWHIYDTKSGQIVASDGFRMPGNDPVRYDDDSGEWVVERQ